MALIVGVLLWLALGLNWADAAVIEDAVSTQTCASCLSMSTNHTGTAAADRHALVGVSIVDSGATPGITTSLTYGVSNMTLLARQSSASLALTGEMFSLAAYPTGLQTITWTFDPFVRASSGVFTMSSVNSGTPLGTPASTCAISSSPSLSCGSINGDLVVDVLATAFQTGFPTVGPNQTQNFNVKDGDDQSVAASSRETATSASTPMSWTLDSADNWCLLCVAVKPAAVATGDLFYRRRSQ
jgi:hypothetical protein